MYYGFWRTGSYPREEAMSRRIRIGTTFRGKGWRFNWQQLIPKLEDGESF
jgi:hypothetical protein